MIQVKCPQCTNLVDLHKTLTVVQSNGQAMQLCLRCAAVRSSAIHTWQAMKDSGPGTLP
jgi:uncharacterized Zn finger protein